MVITRTQKDKKQKKDGKKDNKKEEKRIDNKNTKRSRGGNDGDNDDEQIGEVEFREILAGLFPSKFANQKVKEAKRKQKIKNGKKSKISKVKNDSDASSSASYEYDDRSDNESESNNENESDNENDNENDKTKVDSPFSKKVWKIANKGNNDAAKTKAKPEITYIITTGKELRSDDEDYDEDDDDYNPEEDSMYDDESLGDNEDDYDEDDYDEDDEDEESGEHDEITSEISKTPSSEESNYEVPKLAMNDIEDNFQNKIAPVPKDFQKKCRNIWQDFKKKIVEERKSYIIKRQKKQKKARQENLTSFRKMLKEGDVMNDLRYFNRIMTINEQQNALDEMKKIKAITPAIMAGNFQ